VSCRECLDAEKANQKVLQLAAALIYDISSDKQQRAFMHKSQQ